MLKNSFTAKIPALVLDSQSVIAIDARVFNSNDFKMVAIVVISGNLLTIAGTPTHRRDNKIGRNKTSVKVCKLKLSI